MNSFLNIGPDHHLEHSTHGICGLRAAGLTILPPTCCPETASVLQRLGHILHGFDVSTSNLSTNQTAQAHMSQGTPAMGMNGTCSTMTSRSWIFIVVSPERNQAPSQLRRCLRPEMLFRIVEGFAFRPSRRCMHQLTW